MANPYRAIRPEIKIGATDMTCHANKIVLTPDQQYGSASTFCNPGGEVPTTAVWTCSLDILQSFDTTGAWNVLHALQGTQATFVVYPGTGVIAAATNPEATFYAWIPAIPFLDVEAGATMTYTVEMKVVGEPVFAVTP